MAFQFSTEQAFYMSVRSKSVLCAGKYEPGFAALMVKPRPRLWYRSLEIPSLVHGLEAGVTTRFDENAYVEWFQSSQ